MSFSRFVNFNRSINTAHTDINDKETSGSIQVQKWISNASYMPSIKTSNNPYECYLEQRKNFKTSPGFYLNIADYWLTELKQSDVGIRILTSILELELENVQLLRIVGYRLDQEKEYELADIIFEKVKRLSPSEPQSYRDLALIKEKMGKYEEAVQLFNEVITGQWDSRFDEIELTAIIELNHCLEKAQLHDLKPVDEGFRYKMDIDLRISLAWDTNDTDIDLHVYEEVPRGEHCYFGHRNTAIGGLLSRDFTRGYGPEEYMLRKAPAGKYRVTNKYFSSHQQSLTGGTTILCTFFTNYMRPNEKRECVTMRLSSNKEEQLVCTINIDNQYPKETEYLCF
jgi:Ca-activated chloride channel family protein